MAMHSNAQSVDQWTAWGDAAFSKGEYYGASRYYDGALIADPGRMALQWKQAEACRMSNQYDKAHMLYDKVYRKDQGRTYTEALRWLGEMLLCDAQYKEAATTWKKLLRKEKNDDSVLSMRAKNALLGIELAARFDSLQPTDVIQHLPEPINSYSAEFAALNGPDGKLYFSTLRGDVNAEGEIQDTVLYKTTIVRITTDPESVQTFEVLNEPMNTDGDNANVTWSMNGKYVLFTRCGQPSTCSIHVGTIINDVVTDIHPLKGLPVEATNTQPMLAMLNGSETLFFASNAVGGQGEFDIWNAVFTNGEVKDPKPLGASINTPGNERTPWFIADKNMLWFSSDFLPGLGGYDLFSSMWDGHEYLAPVNAETPWNSPANDLYPSFDQKTGVAFLTSNRKGSLAAKGETCCNDIYKIEVQVLVDPPQLEMVDTTIMVTSIPTDTTPITSSTTVAALRDIVDQFPIKLYFDNDQPEPRSWATTTSHTYGATYDEYKKRVPEYSRNGTDEKLTERFFIEEVDIGYSRLNELVTALEVALRQGESITLDVRGHASPLARNDYNVNLSTRRIESLRNQLRIALQGSLRPYMDSTSTSGGILRIRQLPFGEDRSAQGVSDDLSDLEHSVYSVNAAHERRIEIERINVSRSPPSNEPLSLFFDVGTVRQGVEERFSVPITNSGPLPLHISSARSECDCMQIGTLPVVVPPGDSANVELIYTGRTRPGPLRRRITLTTDGTPQKLELIIDGNVIE
ncbi:MAG: DUF1573 domain-containing protein [Flavobacteriales bacterium]|nr:DUF1573 domain-containing protein [Flavobacteriales bacterium]MBK7239031.1 DUF1573 domain-containing protein [Flavobacteriales bacterium]MBP9139813.1 DUF1573 domain-containing protein [Flavobacteriales bacterium]HQV53558.1 DUF1573 domain-containing protein [Flavobacteriales bacterium]HQX31341.1 DUF1573 domain-containing protein [Flavobacteriales bacterium]